ncbi:MAG: hypothetical protein DI602_08500 [Aliarcobacter butzleri]|nr:MAG: hypothetical protein DI602_08500 [Aliarcobacter butzleri]
MNNIILNFELSFEGSNSDKHFIDLYDVSEALKGFHRTLALTSHLMLHSEVITRAPFVKDINIFTHPPKEGSWKLIASLAIGGQFLMTGLTSSQDTILGHLFFSAYDYVISESLGFNVDYNKTLGQLYLEHNKDIKLPVITESQLDSVIEKVQDSITEMHRPIYKSNTAELLKIKAFSEDTNFNLSSVIDINSYHYIKENVIDGKIFTVTGVVTSYNSNTYRGRIFISEINRPIPFEFDSSLKKKINSIKKVLKSLETHALKKEHLNITMDVKTIKSRNGKLKAYLVQKIWKESLDN